jgi:hypothetical protein
MNEYRWPTLKELHVGFECERRILGEYDTEVCCPRETYHHYCLNTNDLGWYWKPIKLTEHDIKEFHAFYPECDRRYGPGMPIEGTIRVKNQLNNNDARTEAKEEESK